MQTRVLTSVASSVDARQKFTGVVAGLVQKRDPELFPARDSVEGILCNSVARQQRPRRKLSRTAKHRLTCLAHQTVRKQRVLGIYCH